MNTIDISDLFVDETLTVKQALKKLNDSANRILFVVKETSILIGALSDGDIRRGLLSGKTLDDEIIGVYNEKPLSLDYQNVNAEDCRKILIRSKVLIIPLVDKNNRIVSGVSWESIIGDSEKPAISKRPIAGISVVIMAGGKGTRMAPFTNVLPKPLIPIGDKTILEKIAETFSDCGVNDFIFTINYRGEMIKAYFDSIEREYKVTYVKENDFQGTAGCLFMVKDLVQDTFIVSNCDILVKADFADVLDFHKKSGSKLTVISSIQHVTIPYGVIEFQEGGKITKMVEKPEYSFSINTGVYILEKSCIDLIPKNEFFHMTHLIEALMKSGEKVCTYPVNEKDYIDIGQWQEYRTALTQMSGV